MKPALATILVVDDDEAGRYFKTHILSRAGHRVIGVGRGEEALAKVRSDAPSLVLLDVRLPDMSGLDVCRRIKQESPSVMVLQTSAAFVSGKDKVAGLAGGADSYLVEPIEPEELVASVQALLRAREAEWELRTLNETLEQKVTERTRELADAVRKLEAETAHRAKAEEALRHSQKLDALGRLTGGVAHDFNNLLTVVIGNLDRLDKGLQTVSGGAAETLPSLVQGAQRAAHDCEYLVRQLLAFSRRDPLRVETIEVSKVIRSFGDFVRRAVGEQVRVEFELSPAAGICRLDPSQLESAILNLAVNARDAMASGGTLRIKTSFAIIGGADRNMQPTIVGLDELPPGRYVKLTASDTGCGMSDKVIALAFEPFFTTKDVGKGSGLGLSQVYGFVKQSGGAVAVSSVVGKGTTISLYLPQSSEPATYSKALPEPDDEPTGDGETILIVEDNELLIQVVVDMVSELGYRVLHAANGRQALDILQREMSINLLFTDVVMPDSMNGLELAYEAKRQRPELKVLLTSGYSARGIADDRLGEKFMTLAKPYRPVDLARRLRDALNQ